MNIVYGPQFYKCVEGIELNQGLAAGHRGDLNVATRGAYAETFPAESDVAQAHHLRGMLMICSHEATLQMR